MIKRVVVIGAGAVGGSLGGLLLRSGMPVCLIARGAHGLAIRRHGLALRMPDRSHVLWPECHERVHQVDWQVGDLALLATKLNDARAALDDLLLAAGPELPVVCALNGVQGEAWAAERFQCVLGMMVWVLATHLVPGEVRLHSSGTRGVLDTGPYQGDASLSMSEEFCSQLRAADFDAKARPDIMRWKYAKWILNIGGAAQAMVQDDWQSVVRAARAEAEETLAAAGVERVPTEELKRRVAAIRLEEVDGKKRNGGSTWQSRMRAKPLETPWLEGAMAHLAQSLGVPAPINAFLAEAARHPRPLSAAEVLASGP